MICDKCQKQFEPSKGLVKYCSLTCRNSRSFSPETNSKKSSSQKSYIESLDENQKKMYFERNLKGGKPNITKLKQIAYDKYKSKTWEQLSLEQQRRRILEEQEDKCFECGLSHWREVKLSLEIEHKNGIHSDNRRENVCALCPNCHSITPTWRGRNKPVRNGKIEISDDKLILALKEAPSIRKALLSVGMAAKGKNYERAKRLLKEI
jgi:5-methylcytosine-specific restriction endonuclease McrA